MGRLISKEIHNRILEGPTISKDRRRHIRPTTPNSLSIVTVKQRMMNIFNILSTNGTFRIGGDATRANLVPRRQPIDISPQSKYLNLSRKFEAPKNLPKGFKWISIRAFRNT